MELEVKSPLFKTRISTVTNTQLKFQRAVAWLFCIPFYELIALVFRQMGYKIEDLGKHRALFRRHYEKARRDKVPLVVCSNHLTFIDSCLLIWAFGSSRWYFRNFSAYTWNLPAGDFFKQKLLYRIVIYLGKGIYIHRDGSPEHKVTILENCRDLVAKGEVLTVFPEGRRGRHPEGAFEREKVTLGVGKIVTSLKNCRVLCVYLRGDQQTSYSKYPKRKSRFRIQTKLLEPTVTLTGKKAYIEVLQQISNTIGKLEEDHHQCKL